MKKKKIQAVIICSLLVILLAIPTICGATAISQNGTATNQPWNEGFNTMTDWITGPLPTAIGGIALAGYLIMLATGNNGNVATRILQIAMCVAAAMKAPTLIQYLGTSGVLF